MVAAWRGTFEVQTTARPRLVVSADGRGVVSHAGSRLLADLADRTTLTGEVAEALQHLGRPRAVHDPGRVLVDLAVAVADGAECISDIAVLADQPGLFGAVASDSTVWRLLDQIDQSELAAVAGARAAAREVAWAQRAEVTGQPVPAATAAGVELPGLLIDLDASIVICHSEKEQAAATFKSSFGYHPILAFCDNTGEFLAGLLRPGNAGANTAADHITVLDAAVAQIPDAYRHGVPLLVRADGAGCTKAFLAHIRRLRDHAVQTEFTVGWAVTDRERDAIVTLPETAWADAIDADGRPREGAAVAELTGLLPARTLTDYPTGTRILVRRERPHPGAQLDAFEERDGWRYQCFATDTGVGQLAFLDARHRAHARVEDRIRTGKDTGLGRFPSRQFSINAAWLTAVMLAVDLISWTQTMLLHDHPTLAKAEPKTLRYRLLHLAARLTRGARRFRLRLDQNWPWATALAAAFTRCTTLPQPAR
jgi:Transposase DDE domain group 1